MELPRAYNLTSDKGNLIPNQIVIRTPKEVIFQSYRSIIAVIKDDKIYLDRNCWDYSRTTSKYRNKFLHMDTTEIKRAIKNGSIILTNLN